MATDDAKRWLYDDLVAAGVQCDNYESTLYFEDTELARVTLDRYPLEKKNSRRFLNQRPPCIGQPWIEVPFAYLPWWEEKLGRKME